MQTRFDREIAVDFCEVGASGALYAREEIRAVVLGRLAGTEAGSLPGGFRIAEPTVMRVTPAVVMVRYTLHGQGRVTRRTTLYRLGVAGRQAVFHRGTVLAGESPLPADRPDPWERWLPRSIVPPSAALERVGFLVPC